MAVAPDQFVARQLARQDPQLERRRSGVGDVAGEAGEGAEQHGLFAYVAREQVAERHADGHAGDHHLQYGKAAVVAKGPDPDSVLHDQDRQRYRRARDRGLARTTIGHGKAAEPGEPALGAARIATARIAQATPDHVSIMRNRPPESPFGFGSSESFAVARPS